MVQTWRYRTFTIECFRLQRATLRCKIMDKKKQNIVVCCDGTWCGDLSGTNTNIKIIANSFAGQVVGENCPVVNGHTIVCYFPGIGMSAPTLVDHTLDAILATSIKRRCVEAYKFIVENFGEGSKVSISTLS